MSRRSFISLFIFILSSGSLRLHAATAKVTGLGEVLPQAELSHLKAMMPANSGASYTSTTQQIGNFSVTQYVATDGTVFALSWSGSGRVDLRSILGNYYDDYVTSLKNRSRAIRSRTISVGNSHFHVQQGGHSLMRGHAILTDQVPAGFHPGHS